MSNTYEIASDPVATKVQELLNQGALPLNPAFTVATSEEAEVVYDDHRLLVCENDATYRQYVEVLSRAELPYVANNPALGSEYVVVGEIPRDARILSTLVRSVQPHNGEDVRDVFRLLGENIRQLIDREQVAPSAASVNLSRILVARANLGVLLVPPVEFIPAIGTTASDLTEALNKQLIPKYTRFGATALLASFQDGLGA